MKPLGRYSRAARLCTVARMAPPLPTRIVESDERERAKTIAGMSPSERATLHAMGSAVALPESEQEQLRYERTLVVEGE